MPHPVLPLSRPVLFWGGTIPTKGSQLMAKVPLQKHLPNNNFEQLVYFQLLYIVTRCFEWWTTQSHTVLTTLQWENCYMIKHGMNMQCKTKHILHPGQIPVMDVHLTHVLVKTSMFLCSVFFILRWQCGMHMDTTWSYHPPSTKQPISPSDYSGYFGQAAEGCLPEGVEWWTMWWTDQTYAPPCVESLEALILRLIFSWPPELWQMDIYSLLWQENPTNINSGGLWRAKHWICCRPFVHSSICSPVYMFM